MTSGAAPKPAGAADAVPANRASRRRRSRWRGIPAPFVFYLVTLAEAGSLAAVYLVGKSLIPAAVSACLLAAFVLYVNDRKGFVRRRQMRRAFEARRTFTGLEVLVLAGLMMANLFVAALVFLR